MKVSRETVLVTGAAGFIGSFVVERLLRAGFTVRSLTRDKQPLIKVGGVIPQQFAGDLTDRESLVEACAGADAIVHAAGLAHVDNSKKDELFKANVVGTRNLLKVAESQRVKRLVYISSSLSSDLGKGGVARTTYGQTKKEAEELLMSSHGAGLIESVILRPVNVYGVGMRGNISTLISLAHRWRIPSLPLLKTHVSLISVEDLSSAVYLSLISENAAGKSYTVTDGRVYNINEIEAEIYRVLGRKFPNLRLPRLLLYTAFIGAEVLNRMFGSLNLNLPSLSGISMRTYQNLTSNSLFDNSEIVRELDFKPELDLYQMLPMIVQSVSESRARQAD